NLPLMNVSTQIDEIERRFAQERLVARACTLFGGLALLVASVGVFGVMSYSVARRTNEIGIRLALGAERRDLLQLVMGESLVLVAAGVTIGVAGAMASSRTLSSLLFGVAPTDPGTMAGAVAVIVLVSALAGYLPARRASRIDPNIALRYELLSAVRDDERRVDVAALDHREEQRDVLRERPPLIDARRY